VTSLASPPTATAVPFARTPVAPGAAEAVARVLASGWITTGPEVGEFEQEFATLVQAEHAVAVSSCTAALELSLRALRLPAGSAVLVPTVTFCGAVNAVLHAGLRPVLVDVDSATLMPDESTTAAAVRRSGPVAASMVMHFAGAPADVPVLAEAARIVQSLVVEDAAHALGASLAGRPVGSGPSAAACFSFYATKNLPIGEGGMVTTQDPAVADYVHRCRLHGMSRDAWRRYLPGASWRYTVEDAGLKANMTDIQGAIGRVQLGRFQEWQQRRADIAARYDAGLADVPGIVLPARPAGGGHAWHLYVVQVGPAFGVTRDQLIADLAARGVSTSVHFVPLHRQPYLVRMLGADADPGYFPVAEQAAEQLLSLPLYPDLPDEAVDRVCAEIAAACHPRPEGRSLTIPSPRPLVPASRPARVSGQLHLGALPVAAVAAD
jgi:dTDP-4-amino-4,6-dideoxygalactose transaminase